MADPWQRCTASQWWSPSLTRWKRISWIAEFEQRNNVYDYRTMMIQLISSKCLPCLLYALEACPVNKTQERSLEFTVNKVLMKVFRTTSMDVLTECRLWFGIPEVKVLIARRKLKFLTKFTRSSNVLCQNVLHVALSLIHIWRCRRRG